MARTRGAVRPAGQRDALDSGPRVTPGRQAGVWEENGPEAAWAMQVRAWATVYAGEVRVVPRWELKPSLSDLRMLGKNSPSTAPTLDRGTCEAASAEEAGAQLGF